MAQNITWLGNSYSNVGFVDLPKTGGGTARFDDVTPTTAVDADVASGKIYIRSDGSQGTGTASGGTSFGWTKIAETSYQVSTTATSAGTVATWATGHSELWTANKWVYVKIRDTAGPRDGYFYGSDQFFYNYYIVNGSTSTSTTTAIRIYTRYTGGDFAVTAASGTSGYGVWADTLYSSGNIRIRRRYNSTYSLTVDGTFKVEVYLLDPAGGVPIFDE